MYFVIHNNKPYALAETKDGGLLTFKVEFTKESAKTGAIADLKVEKFDCYYTSDEIIRLFVNDKRPIFSSLNDIDETERLALEKAKEAQEKLALESIKQDTKKK